MLRKTLFAPLLAATAMALTVSPAYAGKADRAREAIAAAEAKIHTAETLGAGTQLPSDAAEARATLARAKESLERGDKSQSIDLAIEAQSKADSAIGMMQRDKDSQLAAANAASEQRAADAASAQQQAAAAQDQASAAQGQAMDANARAAAAERSAASSAADAQAARMAAQTPAQVETTVTTQQPAPRRAARKVTRKTTTTTNRAATAAPTTTTTTTVRQAVN